MAEGRLSGLLERFVATLGQRGDGELLERFVTLRDEAAFEALVRRHGPMVLGVCRRVLGHEQDAEDAFQATFLVLAKKASRVQPPGQVGHWLYGVACRTAQHARKSAARRRAKEAKAVSRREETGEDVSGLHEWLAGELAALPQMYREVIVLCDLEGKGRREAAGLLGCPEGTVASRLARAREALARRLTQHGLAVSAGLVASTAKGAVAFAAGRDVAGAVPARVVTLAAEVLGAMLSTRMTRAALLLLVALLAAGVGGLSAGSATRQEGTNRKEAKAAPPAPPEGKAKADEELKKLQGTWVSRSGAAGRVWVIAGKKITAYFRQELQPRAGKFKIDPSQRPKTIDLEFDHFRPSHGVYEVEGDTLTVVLSAEMQPRPTKLEKQGPGSLSVFKRHAAASAIAYDIGETYYENEARADELFTGRQVTVTGSVLRVKRESADYYALLINGARPEAPLLFLFAKDFRKQLAKLEPGQVVTVQGECRGKYAPWDSKVEGIAFDNAKFVRLPD